MAVYYPPVGFHFKVEVLGIPPDDSDVRFSEVGGLTVEVGTEELPEGGENRFTQKYPTRAKYPDLILKRGLLVRSRVWQWVRGCIEDQQVIPKDVDITLLDDDHDPLMTWHVIGAYPIRWSVTDLNAAGNSVVIETLQMFYKYFNVDRS